MISALLLTFAIKPATSLQLGTFVPKDTPAIEARVKRLVSEMTLDEKLEYIGGIDGFYVRAIPRLGLPAFKMSDGPLGLRNDGIATAYPAGVMLGASFDTHLALRYGKSIGEDARARGVNFWLGPGVNLDRIPQNGRNFEYLGEDPILSGSMAAQIVTGVQSYQVCPTVKHFTANDNEINRNRDSSDVDLRTLHELTMMPWEIAIKRGHALGVMTSYNRVNGLYMTENKPLLNVLEHRWGFKGVVMSDWGSTHSIKGPYNAGLDLEMPGAYEETPENLKPLIENGTLSVKPLNDKVARILRVALMLHWLDRPQKVTTLPYINPYSDRTALKIASEGITLLQNRDHLLPLNSRLKGTVLVLGPNADPAVTGGGGSSYIQAHYSIGLVHSLENIDPYLHVKQISFAGMKPFHFDGTISSNGNPGFTEQLFNGRNLEGSPVYTGTATTINHDWSANGPGHGLGTQDYSARWTGNFTPSSSGKYEIAARSDDGMRVWIDGHKVISMWHDQGATTSQAVMNFVAGHVYAVRVEYYQAGGGAIARFGITQLGHNLDKALPANKLSSASAIIAYVGFNPSTESEGLDRTWTLPADQQALLNRACALNKNVIIVVNAGGAIDLAPWLGKAKSIIDAYYPGENGDLALAKILVGQLDPSGHLPFVMPYHLGDLLSTGTYPAVNGQIHYNEGVFIGQRGLDKQHIQPMFAFGSGLSYTTFKNRVTSITKTANSVIVQGIAANTGNTKGSEVLQAYVSYPHGPVQMPIRELKGFQRLYIAAGKSRHFKIAISLQSLDWWNVNRRNWSYNSGQYTVSLGTSAVNFFSVRHFSISPKEANHLDSIAKP